MTPQQNAYFEQARRALKTARSTLDLRDVNASINRAYYATFYAAMAALLGKGESPKTHKGTHSRFFLHFVVNGPLDIHTGDILTAAAGARYEADYDVFSQFDEAAAEDYVRDAERFVDAVEAMVRDVDR